MRKLIILFLLIAGNLFAQLEQGKQLGWQWGIKKSALYQYALDFDGSTEYLSCTPALRLTGEYSLYDNFSDGNYNGWTVSSGAYSVVDSVPLSGGTKSLKCTTAGIISIPCNQAYGSWEFDLVFATGSTFIVGIINSKNSFTADDGYRLGLISGVSFSRRATGVSTAIFSTNTNYVLPNTKYRIKITRNTNGSFTTYIKGGTFGSDYVLVSVTGGGGTNPATDNNYTSSNYFVLDLDANDMIANIVCQQGEGSLDLNSYERIYHSDNRNMTKTGGFAYTGSGNHSIDTTSTEKRTGTYSGKVISTGAGDSTTNYISLPAVNFDTLKTDANNVYEKYTLELWVKSKGSSGLPRVIVKVGNQVKTSDTISNIAFEKVVFNFQSNSLVSNQPILIYLNRTDTVFVDDVTLSKAYDLSVSWWVKTSTNAGAFWSYSQYGSVAEDGYCAYINNNQSRLLVTDGTIMPDVDGLNSINTSSSINGGGWNLVNNAIIRVKDSLYSQLNSSAQTKLLGRLGRQTTTSNIGFYIGTLRDLTAKLNGQIGHLRLTKFTDISQSNYSTTAISNIYNRGKLVQNEWTGGSPIEVAFYDWKGSTTNEILSDKSSMGNNLTGTNIDINDRIKVKGKFK